MRLVAIRTDMAPLHLLMLMLLMALHLHFIHARSGSSQPSLRSNIESFKVMDVLARAAELEHDGRHICHMEVGQPSTGAPAKVVEVAKEFLSGNILGYTNALGTIFCSIAIHDINNRGFPCNFRDRRAPQRHRESL
jgi:hypothetical protein